MQKKILFAVSTFIVISAVTLLIFTVGKKEKNDDSDNEKAAVVRFEDIDGAEICTLNVKKGDNAYPPKAPEHEEYVFRGWNKTLTQIDGDMIVRALYDKINYAAVSADVVYIPSSEKTVTVEVYLRNNPGIASMIFDLYYDDILILENIEFESGFGDHITTPEPYSNPQTVSIISPFENMEASGKLATLTFSVKDSLPDGEQYTADILVKNSKDNTFDKDYDNIFFETINGKVILIK